MIVEFIEDCQSRKISIMLVMLFVFFMVPFEYFLCSVPLNFGCIGVGIHPVFHPFF